MNRTLYFSKVSLDSYIVYNLIENPELRSKIADDILLMLKHESSFVDEYSYKDEDGKEHSEKIEYSLSIRKKDGESIYGLLDRTTTIFVKQRNDQTGEMISYPVRNTEDVEFYYDVFHEYIAFITRRRFKKNMFNEAFAKMMNQCAKNESLPYSFYLESYNKGMSIEEIREFVSKDKHIKELTITYRPANPDEALIEKAREASGSERIKRSNATERSIIYKAKGNITIDGSAPIIQEDIKQLQELNDEIDISEMTKRGYAVVRSVSESGDVKSTADSMPFVRKIKEIADFVDEAKKGIVQILARGHV